MSYFPDVVTAYKNLQKEKETLESTVQVLSTATVTSSTSYAEVTASETESNTKEVKEKKNVLF